MCVCAAALLPHSRHKSSTGTPIDMAQKKREAAASPISSNAGEDQGECQAYFICDAASNGTHAKDKKLKCAQASVAHRARQRVQGGGRS